MRVSGLGNAFCQICPTFADNQRRINTIINTLEHSIIKGINNAVAKRITALAGSGILEEDIYVESGPAKKSGLTESLEDALMCDIKVVNEPQFTVTFGSFFVE